MPNPLWKSANLRPGDALRSDSGELIVLTERKDRGWYALTNTDAPMYIFDHAIDWRPSACGDPECCDPEDNDEWHLVYRGQRHRNELAFTDLVDDIYDEVKSEAWKVQVTATVNGKRQRVAGTIASEDRMSLIHNILHAAKER